MRRICEDFVLSESGLMVRALCVIMWVRGFDDILSKVGRSRSKTYSHGSPRDLPDGNLLETAFGNLEPLLTEVFEFLV